MGFNADVGSVKKNIGDIYDRRAVALFALCDDEALRLIQEFKGRQAGGEFWVNRTKQAMDRMFTQAYRTEDAVGFFMAHGVIYGVYLELANNRLHQAIRPLIESRLPDFRRKVQEIMQS